MRAAIQRPRREEPALFAARAALGLALVALLLRLVLGDDPWTGGIAARLREGHTVRAIDYARSYGWWTAAANVLVVAALLASARRWLGPREAPAVPSLAAPRSTGRTWFLALVAGAIATEAVLAWPRLSQSLWDDEMTAMKSHIDGSYRRGERGELRFVPLGWGDTFWNNPGGNNHVPFSIASRLSLAAWRSAVGGERGFPNEAAARVPAYLAGLASLAATALLLRRIGFAAAGVAAAWLLALHPWHLRYASEARGYAFLLLLVPVTWVLLVGALERGTWRRWILYGLAQTLLLWTHAGMLYQLAATNLVAAVALWRLHRGTPSLLPQLRRWAVTNVGCAVLYAELALPNLVQLAGYLGTRRGAPGVPLRSVASHLLAGLPWHTHDSHFPSLAALAEGSAARFEICVALTLLLGAVGVARLLAAGGPRALLSGALLLPGPLVYVVTWLRHEAFFVWYLVFALPGLVALVALGATASIRRNAGLVGGAIGVAAPAAYLALFASLTAGPRAVLRSTPLVPEREAVLLARLTLDPMAPANQGIQTAFLSRPDYYYDPLGQPIRRIEDLEVSMAEADRRGAPLFVSCGGARQEKGPGAEVIRRLELRDLFEPVGSLYGSDRRGEFHVYRYLGSPAP